MKIFKIAQKAVFFAFTVAAIGFTLFSSPVLARENSPDWSYGGVANPTQWGRLGHDFALCEVGTDQSPIDIDDAVEGVPAKIKFNYVPVPLVVVNNGHTIQVNYPPGSTVSINDQEYELLQFHFHTPSEHTMSGKASALELHLVHRNKEGQLAVVGVMMEEGKANSSISTIWENIPEEKGSNKVEELTINAADLLPSGKSYFSYVGSLTTPPCSEGVKWNVLAQRIQVSRAQIAAFEKLYQMNARPIQSSNGRIIELHKE